MIIYAHLQLWQTQILRVRSKLKKNIIDADSEDENEMNNVVLVPTPSDMRNMMKRKALPVDNDNLCTACSKLKNIIKADSKEENAVNNVALVPTSPEMRNVMKIMRSYLDSHSVVK
ncbi:hypothetical protein TNCV_3257781 [Trichonephila clavipes]|nr:hypothetical protein TNCV_3257781 [Trichonephila clavipes]